MDTPHPQTASELHTFIGGIVWLQQALSANTAQLLAPLRKYVVQRQTDRTYINPYKPDDPEVVQAVKLLKQKVADSATLISPRWDWEFHCFADGAQSKGVGGLIAHFIDTGPPGEKPLHGPELEAFQAQCASTGDPPPPTGWELMSDEQKAAYRVNKKGEKSKEKLGMSGKFSELDKVSGLHLPNRRLPSDQREPQAPECEHTGLTRIGYYAPIAFHSKSLQKQQARWTAREVEVFAIITMLRRWEPYLLGSRLMIHTDCKCLEYLAKYQDTWGKLGRWCSYLSMYSYKLKWCAGVENGCADWLSRAPQLDNYCPDDGELEKEKYIVDDAGNLQFVDSSELRREVSSARHQRLQAMSADATKEKRSKRPTAYSVCAGIGSCMQARERYNIPMDFIGCCEVDPEVSAELETAFPHVPNHGDMRTVLAAMESGELALQPDILIFTVPCQSRSRARLLTEWYNKEHPHHHLWDLQAKFIALAKPKMILIENVPPRSWGDRPTQSMYDELAKKIRNLGYSYTYEEELNCAEYGGNTSRRRYFGVGVKGDVPYTFPAPRTTYSGFRDLLDPAYSVRHNYRCRLSSTESWSPVRLSAPNSSPFRSKQIGKVHPETEKEQELANRLGMQNPKGFRIYSSKHPAPTICSYGAEKYCGPGRHTQFITDKAGIRVMRMEEAARVTGCLPRVVEQFSTIKESLAMRMVGNMVPVEPIGAILGKMVEQYEQLKLHTPVTGSLHSAATQLIKKAKGKKSAEVATPWYPSNASMKQAQRRDPECMSIMQQLDTYAKGGAAALKTIGVSEERTRYLQLHEVDSDGLLRCSDVVVHVYGDADEEERVGENANFDVTTSRVVVPKELRDGILYIHHHSQLAAHASWVDMESMIHEAGYTWKGLGNSCKQTTRRCMDCLKAKRPHSKAAGLLSSRRYRCPFDSLSWDMQDLGKASTTTHGDNRYLLTIMCEFTSYVELYALPDKTAESVADCLIDFALRWDVPSCIWSGHDAEIKNEVVQRVCAYLGVRQMWTSPRYSDGAARQERKHLQINQVLKLLVKGKLREWDDYLPMVKWRLRNTKVQHLGYTPRQMVFGRAAQQLSPSHLSLGDFRKYHPRAKEYMEALEEHLEIIRKEVDRASMITYIESWPRRNAKKKEVKFAVGDYVMLHQPVHVPGAATKLTTSWNGPWKVVSKKGKKFGIVHIESGKHSEDQHVTNLTAAPDPAHPQDYDDQYKAAVQRINPVDRLPTEYDLQPGDDIIVNAGKRNAVAKALEVYQDGSAMVQWHNTKKLDSSPTAAYYPSWYTPKEKHGETASPTGDMPAWDIVDRAKMVTVFDYQLQGGKSNSMMLPKNVRKYFK